MKVKVTVLQMKIERLAPEKNRAKLAQMMAEAGDANPDIVVLPELWDTGFYPRPPVDYAVEGEISRKFLAELARKYRINMVGGSIITERDGAAYNTCIAFDRHGQAVGSYDKIHLFSPSGENKDFSPGGKICLFPLDELTCGAAICYDLRFPELTRQMTAKGAKIIFLPAEWPKSRLAHWRILTQARAVENQIFLIAANGAGDFNEKTSLAGHSMIVCPWGEIIAEADENEAVICAELDMEQITRARKAINVWQDARPDLWIRNSN